LVQKVKAKNGDLLKEAADIAKEFNQHFAAVGEKLARKFDPK
jgi:hypothetical protein